MTAHVNRPRQLPRDTLQLEATLFSKYLLGVVARQEIIDRYIIAVKSQERTTDRALEFVYKYPATIRSIDSYLALRQPDSEMRKRLTLFSAFLEATPEYVDLFLPRKRSFLYLLVLFWKGLGSIVRLGVGSLLYLFGGLGS